jgi:thioredoxin 1
MNKFTREEFETAKTEQKAIIYFGADWCGPCRVLGPVLDEISEKHSDIKIGKVDVEIEKDLAKEFSIRSLPTTFFYSQGEILEKKTGSMSKQVIETLISTHFFKN